jgi:hypothetical protein
MARKSRSAVIVLGKAAAIAIVLTAGCSAPLVSAPVLRAPSLVDAPAYDSPRCEDARRLDAQAAAWWLPSSCFRAVSTPASGT